MPVSFQWDENKARANLAKHGVSFEAATVFPNAEAVNDSLRALAGIIGRQHKALAGK
jgi:uncharacterized DUF497 family protein